MVLVATSFLIYDKVSKRTLATIGQTSEVSVTTDIEGEEEAGMSGESSDTDNQSTEQQNTDKSEDSSKEEEKRNLLNGLNSMCHMKPLTRRINMMWNLMKKKYM